ncbi:hypothetical protein KI688_001692 [Linnemannia hyalina]|uniref:NACHT domain-containing protein n=1 Tax=Linnemannia hyalina TaxID=64524 RepID=A0A9P7XVF4_9FUNG|nr:hypothetical protein KI688_001692 [Linnemannia hyalina]
MPFSSLRDNPLFQSNLVIPGASTDQGLNHDGERIFSQLVRGAKIGRVEVQELPTVEDALHTLRVQRREEYKQAVYIDPLAKLSITASDDMDLFLLMDKVNEFLAGDGQVMLILGDSGAGKSTFNRHLEYELWQKYKPGGRIPLFINLPELDRPDKNLIRKQLRSFEFSDEQIQNLRHHHQLLLICDGYDECQFLSNLHTTNELNRSGQQDIKLIITCRTQYLGPDYRDRFVPSVAGEYHRPANGRFHEAVIAPFTKNQIKTYVEKYTPFEPQSWVAKDYMDRLETIPNLMDLVKNPFLLTLALEALPEVVEGSLDLSRFRVTRVQLYDIFVDHWLRVNKRRLHEQRLDKSERETLYELQEDGFEKYAIKFQRELAVEIFKRQGGRPVVDYVHKRDNTSWKAPFFGPGTLLALLELSKLDPQASQAAANAISILVRAGVQFNGENLRGIRIPGADLTGGQFDSAQLCASDLTGVNLTKAWIRQAHFNAAQMDGVEFGELPYLKERLPIDSCAFSPDGKLLAFCGDNHSAPGRDKISVYDTETWKRIHSLQGHDSKIIGVAFSPCSRYLVSGSWDGRLVLWNCETGVVNRIMEGHSAGTSAVAFSPCGKQVASVSLDKSLRLCDINTGACKVYVSDAATLEPRSSWMSHIGNVTGVSFSPDGQLIVSCGGDSLVKLWDSNTGALISVFTGHTKPVTSVEFSPDGSNIASSSHDHTVRLWEVNPIGLSSQSSDSSDPRTGLAYSPDGRFLITGSFVGGVQQYNSETGDVALVIPVRTRGSECVAYSPDGLRFISGSRGGDLTAWDTQTGKAAFTMCGHARRVICVAFSPCGQQIASGGYDKTVRLWDARSGLLLRVFSDHIGEILSIAFSRDGLKVASGSWGGDIRVWDVESDITGLVWRPDALEFATSCKDGSVRVWKLVQDEETGRVAVKMIWSAGCIGLTVSDADFAGAVGLSAINRKLVEQRGAIV